MQIEIEHMQKSAIMTSWGSILMLFGARNRLHQPSLGHAQGHRVQGTISPIGGTAGPYFQNLGPGPQGNNPPKNALSGDFK